MSIERALEQYKISQLSTHRHTLSSIDSFPCYIPDVECDANDPTLSHLFCSSEVLNIGFFWISPVAVCLPGPSVEQENIKVLHVRLEGSTHDCLLRSYDETGLTTGYARNVATFNSHQSAYILCYLLVCLCIVALHAARRFF